MACCRVEAAAEGQAVTAGASPPGVPLCAWHFHRRPRLLLALLWPVGARLLEQPGSILSPVLKGCARPAWRCAKAPAPRRAVRAPGCAAGLLVPDIPLEETGVIREAASQHGLELVLLTTPTTPQVRASGLSSAGQPWVLGAPLAIAAGVAARASAGPKCFLTGTPAPVTAPPPPSDP